MMMRKKTQGRAQLRYALSLPLLVGLGFLFAQINIEAQVPTTQNSTLPPPPPAMAPGRSTNVPAQPYSSSSKELVVVGYKLSEAPKEMVVTDYPLKEPAQLVVTAYKIQDSIPGEVFHVVEKMPEFPGGQGEMMKFLAQNINYPTAARKDNIEGMVVVQFVIDKAGNLRDPHVVKGVGGGINEEALRVINMMPKWKPGQQKGQEVNVQFNLPIRFALEGNPTASPATASREVFRVVEQMPAFPGGQGDLLKFLATNINYPTVAKENGVEGMVVVQYVIEKDGSISNAKVVKGIGAGCDEEALRVVNAMPNWIAGKQRGQAVAVQFNLPIRFKLEDKKSTVLPTNSTPLKVQDFKASPNPSKGLFNLSFRADVKATKISVYNMYGERLFHQSFDNFDGTYNGQIDLSKYAKGTYLLILTQGDAHYSQNLVKQ